MSPTRRSFSSTLAVAIAVFFPAIEVVVRLSGITDFPTYLVDGEIGFIPKTNQHGIFLHTHKWVFNDRSMGTAPNWNPGKTPNILLIGNSVVMGGNSFDQKDKLGPLLQQRIGEKSTVWPIAAGGWTNVNEIVYLKRNPDVAAHADLFLWEYMSGGLSSLSKWRGEYVFPRSHPLWATGYVFRRFVWNRLIHANVSELPPTGQLRVANEKAFQDCIEHLATTTGRKSPGLLFLYPIEDEYLLAAKGSEWLPERPEINRIAQANSLRIIDISKQKEWTQQLYRPDRVHPTVQGNGVLSRILASAIKSFPGN